MQVQLGKRVRRSKVQPSRSNRVPRAPIDDDGCTYDLRTSFPQRVDGGQYATARGRRVLDGKHSTPCNVGALDPSLQTVCLSLLAYNERIQRPASLVRRVQHRYGNRVGAERKPADRVEIPISDKVEHDPANERCSGVMQRESTQIHVVIRFRARRQHYPAPHDGEIMDKFTQVVALRHVD
jgi:hypothetical protein